MCYTYFDEASCTALVESGQTVLEVTHIAIVTPGVAVPPVHPVLNVPLHRLWEGFAVAHKQANHGDGPPPPVAPDIMVAPGTPPLNFKQRTNVGEIIAYFCSLHETDVLQQLALQFQADRGAYNSETAQCDLRAKEVITAIYDGIPLTAKPSIRDTTARIKAISPGNHDGYRRVALSYSHYTKSMEREEIVALGNPFAINFDD